MSCLSVQIGKAYTSQRATSLWRSLWRTGGSVGFTETWLSTGTFSRVPFHGTWLLRDWELEGVRGVFDAYGPMGDPVWSNTYPPCSNVPRRGKQLSYVQQRGTVPCLMLRDCIRTI